VTAGATGFASRVLLRQWLVGAAASLTIAIFAPKLIVLEVDAIAGVLTVGVSLALLAQLVTAVATALHLHRQRSLVRSLALGSSDIEPLDLLHLSALPSRLTAYFFIAGALASSLVIVPGLRPDKLDDSRAGSLLILAITIVAAAAIPHYVLVRQATSELIELSPLEPLTTLLEGEEDKQIPERAITRRLLFAVAVPVALVGVGAVLVAHAHLRTMVEQTSRQTALVIARTALEPGPGPAAEQSRQEAISAAARLGFLAQIDKTKEHQPISVTREANGNITVSTPIDDGQADVRFSADLDASTTLAGGAVALVAVLIAAGLGVMFGRALAADLAFATRGVRVLGTENVIRGTTRIARSARFAVVDNLGRAIEVLTERFRIFAAAQERALQAREAAQRMRGLLFASVSHDLKSPLNALLGFAELLSREPLTAAQRESLALITKRGRELLGLIETILDAARVEAGQLNLAHRSTAVDALVADAVRKARELAGDIDRPVAARVAPTLPFVPVDRAYATRAIAVVIAHALRAEEGPGIVRVGGSLDAQGRVVIDIEYASRAVTQQDLEALFARQASSRGQGLTLGLSLARSVVELHGGAVEVEVGPSGAPVCHIAFPLVVPGERPRLSSIPSLG
jgi:signal transduction histidine kinase